MDTAIRRVGQPQDAHKFTPHVTLARLRHPELDKVREWLTHHALFTSAEFRGGRVLSLFQQADQRRQHLPRWNRNIPWRITMAKLTIEESEERR